MSGRSPASASEDQRSGLVALAGSRDRGEADRARAIVLTLSGWTSPRIGEGFGVSEDTGQGLPSSWRPIGHSSGVAFHKHQSPNHQQ